MVVEIIAIALVGLIFIYASGTTLYILAAGAVGLFAVKRKLPMLYPSGTIVVKGYDSGYVDLDFSTYKDKFTWGSILGPKDNRITHTGKPQNKERSTGIPILFIKEGEIMNFNPFNDRTPEKGSKLYSELLISEHAAGYNEALLKMASKENLLIITVVLSLITAVLVTIMVAISFGQIDVLNEVSTKIDNLGPAIQSIKDIIAGVARIE